MVHPVLAGIGAGIVRAFFGWAKSDEEWDWLKFIRTLVIFAITGGVIGLFTSNPLEVFLLTFVGVPLEDFLNGLYKSYKYEQEQ